jgi:hypothetical protein
MVTAKFRGGAIALFVSGVPLALFLHFRSDGCERAGRAAMRQAAADFDCDLRDVGGGWVSGGCALHSICACGKRVTYSCASRDWAWRGSVIFRFGFDCRQAGPVVAFPRCDGR